jgi:hypothetical protein
MGLEPIAMQLKAFAFYLSPFTSKHYFCKLYKKRYHVKNTYLRRTNYQ